MARTQQKRSLWTPEEDDKLKEVLRKHPNLSWSAIAKQAELNRTGKSCWERWNNNLRPDINTGEFSPQEDELIIHLKSLGVSWASMAKHPLLERRSPNAIKNRWNNHLKKRYGTISDIWDGLMDEDETSDHSVPEDGLEAWMAESASLITNVDANAISYDDETSDHSVRGDDLEAWTSSSADLIPNRHPNAIRSIMDTYTS